MDGEERAALIGGIAFLAFLVLGLAGNTTFMGNEPAESPLLALAVVPAVVTAASLLYISIGAVITGRR